MTLSRWFALLASTAVFAGCDNATAPPADGQLVARWAGLEWTGTAGAMIRSTPAGDSIYVYANGSPIAVRREHSVAATSVFTGPGTYKLGAGAAAFYETVGGDVLTATYTTTPQAMGTLTVTRFDGIGGIVEGTISFDAVSTDRNPEYGSRASLEDGRFRATVREFPQR